MALPTTVVAAAGVEGYSPPFKSSAGNFYVIARTSDVVGIDAYKASDPTSSWTAQDTVNNPTAFTSYPLISSVQKGDVLYIASINVNAVGDLSLKYHEFNMAADTWSITEEAVDGLADDPTFPWASIAVRSDGDVVVVYAGDTDAVMGGAKERVDYNVRTTGTWGGPQALGVAAGDVHDGNPNCVLGTNDFVHCVWQHTANVADPPTAWTNTHGRSIDPADDSLSTVKASSLDSGSDLLGEPNIVTYDDGGTQRISVSAWVTATQIQSSLFIEDVNDEIDFVNNFAEVLTAERYVNGEVGISTFVELSGDLHQLYAGGGTAGVDQDIYYTKSTDNGTNWDAETEEIDAITVNYISANIYVRGSDTVLAYVYDNAGTQYYNEKVLIAGETAVFLPFYPKRPNVLLRM